MNKYRDKILYGNLLQVMLIIALPVALNNLLQAMYNIIDTYLAVSISGVATSAMTFANPIQALILSVGNGLAIAGTAIMARHIGANEIEKAKKVCAQLFVIAILLGFVLAFLGLFLAQEVLIFFGATEVLAIEGAGYLRFIMFTAPFTFLFIVYVAYKRAFGHTKNALILSSITMIIKIISSIILLNIFSKSLTSIGMGLFIAYVIVSIYIVKELFLGEEVMRLNPSYFKIEWKILIGIFIIALPVCIEKSSLSLGHIVINGYILDFGEIALAGLGITNRVNSIAFSTVSGIGAGLGIIVAQCLGNNDRERVKQAIKVATKLALFVSIVLLAIQLLLSPIIIRVFSNGEELLNQTIHGSMLVIAPSVIFWALFQVIIGAFQGSGQTRMALFISLARLYVLRVPMVYLCIKVFGFGEESVWYAMLFSNAGAAVFAWLLYLWKGVK